MCDVVLQRWAVHSNIIVGEGPGVKNLTKQQLLQGVGITCDKLFIFCKVSHDSQYLINLVICLYLIVFD